MRVLLTGAGGRLGQELSRVLCGDELFPLEHSELDIRDEPAVWAAVHEHAPEVVVNAAAQTNVEACERDPDSAWDVNAGGAANLARACHAVGGVLVHISTSHVFDGTLERPYTEFDRVTPQSVYGRTKAAGEQLVRELCPVHQIVRAAWLHCSDGDNFVRSVLRQGRAHGTVTTDPDQIGSPTFGLDLSQAIRRLAATRRPGTYHVTNDGTCTRAEFAREALRLAGLDADVVARRPANRALRPMNSRLEGRNTRFAGIGPLPHWREGLAGLLQTLRE